MSKSTAMLGQARAILQMVEDKGTSAEQLQAILSKGLLTDLLDGNIEKVKRDDFRALLGLSSLSVLTSRTPHDIGPLDNTLDLDIFYKTRAGLYVWNDFVSTIVAKAKVSKKKPTLYKVYGRDLTADALDEAIEKGVGKNHYFEEREVALLVAKMVKKQEGGTAGSLLNNGKANLFYTSSCVVYVRWSADGREWHVGVPRRDGGDRWYAGHRVFSRN
jgi:hypothetical protein